MVMLTNHSFSTTLQYLDLFFSLPDYTLCFLRYLTSYKEVSMGNQTPVEQVASHKGRGLKARHSQTG